MSKVVCRVIKLVIVNSLTIIRLVGSLMLPFIYYKYGASFSALFTIILFLTDAFDGFLARTLKVQTFFGSIIDASSDKLLNIISLIILGLEYNVMFAPIIIEIAILYTMYSTYRYGGNIQASKIGKIKTIILDVFVVLSFVVLSLPAINIYKLYDYNEVIISIFSLIILVSCIYALYDYLLKNKKARENPKCKTIKLTKKKRKSFDLIKKQLFDTNYYLKHKDESIIKQFYI